MKSRMLPPEIRIVGLAGFAGSGKDYIASNFFTPMGYFKVAFANGFKHKVVGSGVPYEAVFTGGEKDDKTRWLLQQEGTERGRDIYGKDIWSRTLESYMTWNFQHNRIFHYVISDVRFHNEINWVKDNGKVIFIESDRKYELEGEMANHPSEAELREVSRDTWDFIITNNKDTDKAHLHKQIDAFMRGDYS